MSALSIDKKIARGFAKVGKKLGFAFNLYRPDGYTMPLQDRNRVMTVPMTWSKDESFTTNPEPTLDYFILYCDYTVLAVGDIMRSVTEDRTFLVSEINPFRGAVGVQTNESMSILRTVYTPAADTKTALQEVVTDMPCAFQFQGAASNDAGLSTVSSSMTSGQSQIEVWTVLPVSAVKLADVLEVNGNRYLITSLDAAAGGIKIKAKSTRAGK